MSIRPASLDGSTSGTTNTGSDRSLPPSIIRTRPGRSVKSMSLFDSQANPHGTSRPDATVSIVNWTFLPPLASPVEYVWPSVVDDAGWLQAKRDTNKKKVVQYMINLTE